MSLLQKVTEDFKVPEILERRTLPEEYKGMRWLDDEEVVISSLLDQQGHIQRLVDFMVILTRIEKMDHRLFCLELIKSSLSSDQKLDFVQLGGYRVLRRWMKLAEEDENVDELQYMLSVCEKLPFDEKAVRQAEIGKAIKKLTKFQPSSGQSASDLHAFASKVMGLWTEELQKAADIAAAAEAAAKATAAAAATVTAVEKKAVASITPTAVIEAKPLSDLSQQATFEPSLAPEAAPTAATPKSTKLLDIIRKSEPIALNATSLSSSFVTVGALTSPALKPLPSTGTKGGEKRERRQLDMEASAKKLLAVRSQQQVQQQEVADSEDATAMDVVASVTTAIPLGKGGMKNKAAPRKKMSVKWADETGGLLRDVRLIEVEKIKSTVASYKSHKDLVKKEKQMEKETYFSGDGGGMIEEVMTKTTDWRKPKRLVLPIDITDNLGTPTDSTERGGQQKRQSSVLEALYLDDSLIPDDPDEDVDLYLDPAIKDLPPDDTNMEEEDTSQLFQVTSSSSAGAKALTQQQRERQALSKPPPQELSWYAEDETPEETIPTFIQQQANAQAAAALNMPMYAPSSSMVYGQQGLSGSAFGNLSGNTAQLPFYLQQQQQQQSFYSAYSQPSGQQPFFGNGGHAPTDNSAYSGSSYTLPSAQNDPQQLLRSLPLSLQTLDMRSVSILVQDPSLLPTLLLADQSVDQHHLRLLQGSSSATDYRLRLSQQSQQSQQPQQPLTQLQLQQQQAMDVLARWGGGGGAAANNAVGTATGGLQMPMVNMSQGAFGNNRNDRVGGQRHFTSKSQTPCRFFNTAKGCLQGDKCPFGHFANGNGGSANAGTMGSPSAGVDGERSLFGGQGRGGMGGRGNHRRLRK